jgi:NADH-quinone oxidoreductase subunit L
MIVRCGALFYGNQAALVTIACVGAFTALFAATIALRQFDLKKVFAYSTISQLGYMFVGAAVLAPVAGIFHLVTHAFFKALLFLSSGVVMHAMAGELDMRKMSGLRRVLPITNIVIGIGCLALAGFPLLSGFFSKDQIVGAAMHQSIILFLVLLFTSFLTAYYTFRLYFRVFWGPLVVPEAPAPAHGHGHEPHEHAAASESAIATGTTPSSGVDVGPAHHGHHNHEPASMILPLILLAAGTILASFLIWNEGLAHFLGKSPSLARGLEMAQRFHVLKTGHAEFGRGFTGEIRSSELLGWIIGGAVSIAGIVLAYMLHLADRRRAEVLAERLQPMTSLIEHKYWVDEIYQAYIIEPLRNWGKFLFGFDRWIVDGLVNVTGFVPQIGGGVLRIVIQRGALQGYALVMLLGIMLILIFIFL